MGVSKWVLPAAAAAVVTAAPLPALAQATLTPETLATVERIGAIAVSPDGRWLIHEQTTTDPVTYARDTRLMARRVAGEGPSIPIADQPGHAERAPVFAPDGRSLYFTSAASGRTQVWRVAFGPDGASGAAQRVTDAAVDLSGALPSPDGRRMLAWADAGERCADLGCTDTGDRSQPGPGSGRVYDQLFVRHWDSWETPGSYSRPFIIDLGSDGVAAASRAAPLPVTGDAPSKPFGGAEELAWAADGKSVFLAIRKADRDEPRSTNLDIWQAPVDGPGPARNLTAANQATDTLPTPSPDGRWLAYAAMARPGYEADRQVLMLRDLATGATRALTANWDRSVGSIAWMPDSRAMIVTAQDTLDHPAFRVTLDGKVTRLSGPGSIGTTLPQADGGLVMTHAGIATPPRVVLRDARGRERVLVDANPALTATARDLVVDRFRFAGAQGAPVWGMITRPRAVAPGAKLPVAFVVHGGPQGSFGDAWSYRWNPRVMAEAGYAVVSIDFHGSTGYGQAFTDAINRDWGGKPLEDLKRGLAAAGARDGAIDIANACALGASYGGYMMNWIAGQWSDGFRCLVNHAGVFDLRAMAFETEELWFDEWDHGGPWWSRPDAERWNPVNHVTKWRTPTLVTHGEKDFRIPYTQSLAAFTALQRQGIDSRLLIFPDENHWILKPKNSFQWHREVFGWLDRHLKPGAAPASATP